MQIQERQDDPLVYHHGIKAKWTLATITAQRLIQQRISEIQIPFCLLHGSEDTTVRIASSKFLMEHSRSEDKSMKVSFVHRSNANFSPIIACMIHLCKMRQKHFQLLDMAPICNF